jgi:hypothetical protein
MQVMLVMQAIQAIQAVNQTRLAQKKPATIEVVAGFFSRKFQHQFPVVKLKSLVNATPAAVPATCTR